MTDNTEPTKKTEEPVKREAPIWNFTQDDFVVRADSLEEAQKLYEKKLTEQESDNG